MRHFLRLSSAPSLLPCGVLARSAAALLIAFTRKTQCVATRLVSAAVRTVTIAVITLAADRHGFLATLTPILSVTLLAHEDPHLHSTAVDKLGQCAHKHTRGSHFSRTATEGPRQTVKSILGPSSGSAAHEE
jgi:hypothetical protein